VNKIDVILVASMVPFVELLAFQEKNLLPRPTNKDQVIGLLKVPVLAVHPVDRHWFADIRMTVDVVDFLLVTLVFVPFVQLGSTEVELLSVPVHFDKVGFFTHGGGGGVQR